MKVLVTGANGHIGANVIRALWDRGHEAIGFVRKTSDLRSLDGLELQLTKGDVEDKESLLAAAEGCDAIIHTAARLSLRDKDPEDVLRPARVGTRNVLEVAREVGASKVVHTSSVVAVGPSDTPKKLRTEDDWHPNPRNMYYRAKVESERIAWDLSDELDVPLSVLCPSWVLGPYDYGITATTRIVRLALMGRFSFAPGGWNVVSAADVGSAFVSAVEGDVAGRRYIVAGENLTFKRTGELITELTGIRVAYLPMPRPLALLGIPLMAFLERLRGLDPAATYSEAREVLGKNFWFDTSRAEKELDLNPTPAREVIGEAIRWVTHNGQLDEKTASRLSKKFPSNPSW